MCKRLVVLFAALAAAWVGFAEDEETESFGAAVSTANKVETGEFSTSGFTPDPLNFFYNPFDVSGLKQLVDGNLGGADYRVGPGMNTMSTWTWAEPKNIAEIIFYTFNGDGRAILGIGKIEVQNKDGTWIELPAAGGTYPFKAGSSNTRNRIRFLPEDSLNALAQDAVGLRITYDGTSATGYNGWRVLYEIEVLEYTGMLGSSRRIAVDGLTKRGNGIVTADLAFDELPDATLYALYGAEWNKTADLDAWEHKRALGTMRNGTVETSVALDVGDAAYLRFALVTDAGDLIFSATRELSGVETEATDLPLVSAFSAGNSPVFKGLANASFEVVSAGAGADDVDVTLDYGTTPNVTDGSLTVAGVTGARAVDIPSLHPSTTYYVRLVADNGAGGVVTNGPVSFVTPEPYVGVATSAANGHYDDFWTTYGQTAGNILAELTNAEKPSNLMNLCNGSAAEQVDINGGVSATWNFNEPKAISEIIFYANNGDARAIVSVASIEVADADGNWTTLPDSTFSGGVSGKKNKISYRPRKEGTVLAFAAHKLKITFSTDTSTGGYDGFRRYYEVEAIRYSGAIDEHITLGDAYVSGGVLTAPLTFPAVGPGRLYALAGIGYSSEPGTNGWERVVDLGPVAAGVTEANATLNLFDSKFVRFAVIPDDNPVFVMFGDLIVADEVRQINDVPPVFGIVNADCASNGTFRVTYDVASAGTDADAVTLTLDYGPDADHLAERIVREGVIGPGEFTFGGILPGVRRSYRLIADNGRDSANVTTSAVLTATMTAQNLAIGTSDANAVNLTSINSAAYMVSERDILLGKTPSGNVTGPSVLVDGRLNDLAQVRDDIVAWSFDTPQDIAEIVIITHADANDFRSFITVTNISVQTGSDEWVTLPNSSFAGGENAAYNRFSLVSADDVNALATGVTGLRIMFSTNDAHKNDYLDSFRSVREIEALAPVMPVGKSVSVTNLKRAGDTIAADLAFEGFDDAHVFAMYGNSWNEKLSTNGWATVVDLGPVAAFRSGARAEFAVEGEPVFLRYAVISDYNPQSLEMSETFLVADIAAVGSVPPYASAEEVAITRCGETQTKAVFDVSVRMPVAAKVMAVYGVESGRADIAAWEHAAELGTVAAGETFTGRFTVRKAELDGVPTGFARVVAVPPDGAEKPIFSLVRPFRFKNTGIAVIVR